MATSGRIKFQDFDISHADEKQLTAYRSNQADDHSLFLDCSKSALSDIDLSDSGFG